MREIEVNDKVSMKIFNQDGDMRLGGLGILIIPYNRMYSYEEPGSRRINVSYGGVIGALRLSKKGAYASGYGIVYRTVKDIEMESDIDIQKQIDGYLGLLALTEGYPVSVVLAENLPLCETGFDIFQVYKDTFVEENRTELEEMKSGIESRAMKAYSLRFPGGWKRRLKGKTMTCYYGSSHEVLENIAKMTHPNSEMHQF
ncbi:MAG: hypothetical protein QMD85_03550 [Candidatus Aenigmarchaeota archaeon]|nr:hypothetical protein [Candidatus Aenigmarchaeota archaeon]MDI6722620.1 hypothetical protein [Candidatus Aenigmarchaeota archaeon]